MKKYIILVILSLLALFFPKIVFATEAINKFGIHIINVTDLEKAQELVNSSGGDWGWVTVVIRDDEMNFDKWQGFMDECRDRHIIPLVRVATHLEGTNWAKPKEEDAEKWADFLNKLNWPISDRFVIIFNEPNHAKEWGGEVNPKEYSHILLDFSSKFKVQSSKFKILNAGLDMAAPNSKTTMESFQFMKLMDEEIPGIFEKIDGWASHSYANHGFLGKPWDYKKTSIRGYEFELNHLKNYLGLKKDLPVFITETGWPKSSSKFKVQNSKLLYYDEQTVASYLKYAFENVWLKDPKVIAVTPFVLNYPDTLFYDFSWIDKEGTGFPQFYIIKNLKKNSWKPKQENKFSIEKILLPPFFLTNSIFKGTVLIKNTGESIWGEYGEKVFVSSSETNIYPSDLKISKKIKPSEKISLEFTVFTGNSPGIYKFGWENSEQRYIKVDSLTPLRNLQYQFWEKVILNVKSFISK